MIQLGIARKKNPKTYGVAFHRSRKKSVPRFKVTTEGVLAQPVDDAIDQSLNLLGCFWMFFFLYQEKKIG